MDIDDLVARFAALPGATVARGPRHPSQPQPALTGRLSRFFGEQYPGLDRDQGYVEFMWTYAGLSRNDEDRDQLFDIFGFGDGATNMDELEQGMVDEDGVFAFADCAVGHDLPERPLAAYEIAFGFDLAGRLGPGVYRWESTTDTPGRAWVKHAADFRAFLAEAVANGGVWPRPRLT